MSRNKFSSISSFGVSFDFKWRTFGQLCKRFCLGFYERSLFSVLVNREPFVKAVISFTIIRRDLDVQNRPAAHKKSLMSDETLKGVVIPIDVCSCPQ